MKRRLTALMMALFSVAFVAGARAAHDSSSATGSSESTIASPDAAAQDATSAASAPRTASTDAIPVSAETQARTADAYANAPDPATNDSGTAIDRSDASLNETGRADASASSTENVIRGTVVSIDMRANEIQVKDDVTKADRRITVDPNALSAASLMPGDRVRIDLEGGVRAQAVRVTNV